MLDTELRGKKALVTGGGVGIGLAIAKRLADEGVDVAIANRSPYPEALDELRQCGVRAAGILADVSSEADVVRMVAEARSEIGGLDLYVNNFRYCRGEAIKIGEKFGLRVKDVGVVEEREQRILQP